MSEVETGQESGPGQRKSNLLLASERLYLASGMHPKLLVKIRCLPLNLTTVGVPHTEDDTLTLGSVKQSYVVERYINKLMRTGPYTGKKQTMKALKLAR